MRYIDADALIDYLQYNLGLLGKPDVEKEPIAHGCYIVLEDMLVRILTTHTAEVVEVRHGEWKKHFAYGSWHYDCSICNDGFATGEEFRIEQMPNYCSNCGAKMDRGVTE